MTATIDQQGVSTEEMRAIAQQLRVDSIRNSSKAGSGHPTSSLSPADLMAVLLAKYLRYDYDNPENPNNDHLIFSKGHASSLVYSMFRATGAITDDEMMTYRQFGSRLQGHPTPVLPWVDVATGSLGQGLPIGVGVALAGKYVDKLPYRVWVVCGDSELAEGSIWEAFDHASNYNLGNLTMILDMNRLGQRGETMHGWDAELYAERARAFGWHAITLDGHDLDAIDQAFAEAVEPRDQPTVLVARTLKGKGVSFIEDKPDMHGKPIVQDRTEEAIEELGGKTDLLVEVQKPEPAEPNSPSASAVQVELPTYELGSKAATRVAYGDALQAVGARPDVVALDGEVSNSTYAEKFAKEYPDRYFEMFIAEQQMIAAAVGFSVRGYIPFASTFAAFLSRAYDFVRMAAVSDANIRICGSHAGVSIGPDGPSQMGLEDIASFRAVNGSTVLYPSDANQAAQLVALMADTPGISYLRTTRESTEVIYGPEERFTIGGSYVVRRSDNDQVAVVAAGITLHEAIKAADELAGEGISVRLIDLYSVKPIDAATLEQAVADTGGRLVVSEDHRPEGGVGEAVLSALGGKTELKFKHLAVNDLPGSGKPEELMDAAGISAKHIAAAVRQLVK